MNDNIEKTKNIMDYQTEMIMNYAKKTIIKSSKNPDFFQFVVITQIICNI